LKANQKNEIKKEYLTVSSFYVFFFKAIFPLEPLGKLTREKE